MRVIRSKIFETNSSSVHSLSINNNVEKNVYEKDCLVFSPENYEWGFSILNTAFEKFSYLLALIASYSDFTGYYEDNEKPLDEFLELPDVERVIEAVKQRGVTPIFSDNCLNFGHVDHQSVCSIDDFLNGIEIEDFIFNNRYVVIIDNDNH